MIALNKTTRMKPNRLSDARRKELVLSVQAMVWHHAHRMAAPSGVPADQLASAGNLGAVWAARHFRPALGFKFTTYADFWIRNRIVDEVQSVRVAGFTHTGRGQDRYWRPAICPTGQAERDECGALDLEPSPAEDPALTAQSRCDFADLLRCLPARHAEFAQLRWGLDWTLRQIARHFGFSPQRAEQMQGQVLDRLRRKMAR